ncbi:hypothetical protein HaLaN_11527 [Haematococcus lacustris]|uniref:Uncharacterized protein n=1 Tax=Haematococcus lacustris TaxID=44745 RepID=A0A699YYF1_HAELA|nr:hypothetical protein HaLaN_11527 [Haematococcus lacustris]
MDSQLPLPTGQAEGQALPSAAAAFFLQLGLQAMRAGNPEAGLHRLPATLAAPLGAVFGAQGDASKALGRLGQAAALYAASVACTQAAANLEHPEATHVMTVSINKLGDCHFLGQEMLIEESLQGSQVLAPPWGRWLDRDSNGCLDLQRIGESKQRPLELCSWERLKALPPIGKEYQQRYKLVNDRRPKARQRLHQAAEYQRGIDGRARNNA